jgi:hypothetical protein
MRLSLCILVLSCALAAVATPARAEMGKTLVHSTHPYWDVGDMDPDLGRLCATGKFNEVVIDRYVARFSGPKGPAVLGIAKGTGLNLRDPGHKAIKSEDYFFFADGTSSCAVYVGGRTPKTTK